MSSKIRASAPNLEYFRKQAKALVKAIHAADAASVARVAPYVSPPSTNKSFLLSDAQLVVAREQGYPSWPKFKSHIDSASAAVMPLEPEPASTALTIAVEDLGRELKMSDEKVKVATGKAWAEWVSLLDAAGLSAATHQQIVAVLKANGVGSWWRQMVTVGYERAKGLRVKNMSCAGDYKVAVSRTFAASIDRVFSAWNAPAELDSWLREVGAVVRTANLNKNLRITWPGGSTVVVNLIAKGEAKTQCTADHTKLAGTDDVEAKRAYWAEALERLRQHLEK